MLDRKSSCALRVILLLVSLSPMTSIAAQRRLSAAADAGIAFGQGRGGSYNNRDLKGLRVSASVRVAAPRVGVFLEASRESLGSPLADKFVCLPGDCAPWYPRLQGWSTAAGLLLRPHRSIEARLGAGPARYTPDDGSGGSINAVVGLADLAVYPESHVGLAIVGQYIALSRYRGDRLTIRPLTVAIRIR